MLTVARARKRPSPAIPRPVLSRCRIGAGCASARPRRGVMSRRRERETEPVWVSPPAPDLFCSVCSEVFTDPVTLACGHTFCRACAVSWFTAPAKLCPAARCPASKNAKPATLATAWTVKGTADALRVYCRFGLRENERGALVPDPEGRPAQLCHGNAAAHEAACEHALEACPFAGCGVQRRRRDADAHDTDAAVAHARGERDARLALEASSRGERDARLRLETQVSAANARLGALEARLAAVALSGATQRRAAPSTITGAILRTTLRGHQNSVACCAWSPDGAMLVSAGFDTTLKLWDATSLACIAILRGHTDMVLACVWSPDGRSIASCSSDYTVKLWDAETGSCKATLEHDNEVDSCSWSPDGRSLASIDEEALNIWDVTTCSCTSSLAVDENLNFCAWSPGGRVVLLCGATGTVKQWDVASRSCIVTLNGHRESLQCGAWSPDGSRFVTASNDCTLKVWSAAAPFRCTAILHGHNNMVMSCAWSPDGRTIASGSGDKTMKLWDIATASCVATLGNAGPVRTCAWSPDGRTLASGSDNGTLSLWDVQRS